MEWEYKIVTIPIQFTKPDPKSAQDIAALGSDGWELVSVTPVLNDGNTVALVHHMRRQKDQARRAGFAP